MNKAYSLYDYLDMLPDPETIEEKALTAYSNMLDDISIAVAEYRMKHNLSQNQLAEKLSISQSLISSYECGSRNISIEKLCLLMAKIGKDVSLSVEDFYIQERNNKETAAYVMNPSISEEDSFAA